MQFLLTDNLFTTANAVAVAVAVAQASVACLQSHHLPAICLFARFFSLRFPCGVMWCDRIDFNAHRRDERDSVSKWRILLRVEQLHYILIVCLFE